MPTRETALRGFQRKYLRGLAHRLEPVVHVGAAGATAQVLRALAEALSDHELVKVRLHRPEDKKALARFLADESGAELCGLVGHTVILYRAHAEDPRIELPARELLAAVDLAAVDAVE
jgi:RNA-binding protein